MAGQAESRRGETRRDRDWRDARRKSGDEPPPDREIDLRPPNKLIVWPEYGSSGIWHSGPRGVGEVYYDELELPNHIRYKFKDWIQMYWDGLEPHDFTLEDFNTFGRDAARMLKAFVGPDAIVEYSFRPGDQTWQNEIVE